MPLDVLRRWLGFDTASSPDGEEAPLRAILDSLDSLPPARARHLARFAFLLGRVAHADHHVSIDETHAMEALVVQEGGLEPAQALVVVGLAKSAHLMFGGTADYEVAREFAAEATYDEKLALARCLFRVAGTDQSISVAEESEIHRVANVLKLQPHDLTALRVAHAALLPGLSRPQGPAGDA